MGSLAEKTEIPSTMEVLEALAAWRAMTFMEELGLKQAIFEGDSKLVVKALVGDVSIRSSIGHTVKDCNSLMDLFQTCTFSHVRWPSNGVAHDLARRARNSSPFISLDEIYSTRHFLLNLRWCLRWCDSLIFHRLISGSKFHLKKKKLIYKVIHYNVYFQVIIIIIALCWMLCFKKWLKSQAFQRSWHSYVHGWTFLITWNGTRRITNLQQSEADLIRR